MMRPMPGRIAIGFLAVALSACGPSPAPAVSSGPPVVECLGQLDQATCDKALPVVLAAVAPSGSAPTTVWLNDGALSPVPDLLFDPSGNFPMPFRPELGTFLGSAEVTFAGTDRHAGLNLYDNGSAIVADLVGYAVPRPGWCSGDCP